MSSVAAAAFGKVAESKAVARIICGPLAIRNSPPNFGRLPKFAPQQTRGAAPKSETESSPSPELDPYAPSAAPDKSSSTSGWSTSTRIFWLVQRESSTRVGPHGQERNACLMGACRGGEGRRSFGWQGPRYCARSGDGGVERVGSSTARRASEVAGFGKMGRGEEVPMAA